MESLLPLRDDAGQQTWNCSQTKSKVDAIYTCHATLVTSLYITFYYAKGFFMLTKKPTSCDEQT